MYIFHLDAKRERIQKVHLSLKTRGTFMGVTAFGKILRKRRIDSSEILGDMAKRLDVSASYLSSIENGLREIPDSFVEKIAEEYDLSEVEKQELEEAQAQSKGSVNVPLGEQKDSSEYLETAVMFAKDFSKLTEKQVKLMKEMLEKFQAESSGEKNGSGAV